MSKEEEEGEGQLYCGKHYVITIFGLLIKMTLDDSVQTNHMLGSFRQIPPHNEGPPNIAHGWDDKGERPRKRGAK
eukprot:scaffold268_cov210-Ochromonas_danica.AAC.9